MSFDNRIFNVNGRTEEDLLSALKLVFNIEGEHTKAAGWKSDKEKGLILFWHYDEKPSSNMAPFPAPMTASEVMPTVLAYLRSEEAEKVKLDGWEEDADHDGHNGAGWRVYLEDWGHIDHSPYAICAIKRIFVWYGK